MDEYITGFTEIITPNKKQIYILGGTDVHCSVENNFFVLGHPFTHFALGYEAMKSRSRPEPLRVILAERRNQNRALSLPGREVEDEGS